jgi:predicted solute-binding protein
MLHGQQRGVFDITFCTPSECARVVAAGEADIGIIPSIELSRHNLAVVPGIGIASRGPVRSILLVSKKPLAKIKTLAGDSSSRTSVALTRVILRERYGVEPRIVSLAPDLEPMLAAADAALIIGDPALRLNPDHIPYHLYDLGREWTEMTGLPMVFAVWAGPAACITDPVIAAFQESYRFGRTHLEDIIQSEAIARGFPPELARAYLTRHIVHELGASERQGLELFLSYAAADRPVTSCQRS